MLNWLSVKSSPPPPPPSKMGGGLTVPPLEVGGLTVSLLEMGKENSGGVEGVR